MQNKKVLITGANGQLGIDMVNGYNRQPDVQVFGFDKHQLNVLDKDQVNQVMNRIKPDIVVHCAAYTKVDQAEQEPDLANEINGTGAKYVAEATMNIGSKLVYISTDYVFSGKSIVPNNENSLTDPINQYGYSKLLGESYCTELNPKHYVVRTSWLYGMNGGNFVKTILRLASAQKELRVVNDQIGSPTFTIDLVRRVIDLTETEKYGIYHISNSGECSWYEFAKEIVSLSGLNCDVVPTTSEEYPSLALRPAYSVLAHDSLRRHQFPEMRHWKDALKEFMVEYKSVK